MLDGIVLGVVNILEASGGRWKRVEGLYESERGKERKVKAKSTKFTT
jgi:hypothetical protein